MTAATGTLFLMVVVGDLSRARDFDYGSAVYVRSYSAAKIREVLGLK